jgi:hypothetical protein
LKMKQKLLKWAKRHQNTIILFIFFIVFLIVAHIIIEFCWFDGFGLCP